jgi:hypothetical protein
MGPQKHGKQTGPRGYQGSQRLRDRQVFTIPRRCQGSLVLEGSQGPAGLTGPKGPAALTVPRERTG